MRRLCSITLVVFLLFAGALPAYAQSGVTYSDNTADSDAVIVDWAVPRETQAITVPPEASTSVPASDMPDTTAAAEPAAAVPLPEAQPDTAPTPEPVGSTIPAYPQDGETVTENGVVLVKKTCELAPEADPQALVEEFERDGHHFTLREILREELPGEAHTRTAVKVAVTITDNDDRDTILAQFPSYIDHAEDGSSGQLALDPSTIITEAEEYEAYSYAYTKTEEITGLSSNDPALVPKERAGMTLVDISFRESGGAYIATLTWQGTAAGQRPVSYTSSATYSGEISKTVPGNILYTYVYEGAPLAEDVPAAEPPAQIESPAEIQSPQEAEPDQASSPFSVLEHISLKNVLLILIGVAYPLGLTLLHISQTKKQRKLRRENREALEEIARFIRGEA